GIQGPSRSDATSCAPTTGSLEQHLASRDAFRGARFLADRRHTRATGVRTGVHRAARPLLTEPLDRQSAFGLSREGVSRWLLLDSNPPFLASPCSASPWWSAAPLPCPTTMSARCPITTPSTRAPCRQRWWPRAPTGRSTGFHREAR